MTARRAAAFTADDFVSWFEKMYQDKEVVPSATKEISVDRAVKIDETTLAFEFDSPHFLCPWLLADDIAAGGGRPGQPYRQRQIEEYPRPRPNLPTPPSALERASRAMVPQMIRRRGGFGFSKASTAADLTTASPVTKASWFASIVSGSYR